MTLCVLRQGLDTGKNCEMGIVIILEWSVTYNLIDKTGTTLGWS